MDTDTAAESKTQNPKVSCVPTVISFHLDFAVKFLSFFIIIIMDSSAKQDGTI